MLRKSTRTVGVAMAVLCLLSTLVRARNQTQSQPQGQSQTMTCTKTDANDNCIQGRGTDNQWYVVKGEKIKTGEKMTCLHIIRAGDVLPCTNEFIPLSFWYDAPLISRYSDRRQDPWLVYGLPSCSLARWSFWISRA